ncbi:MAG TPA: electron transport complex subunit E [Bacillota bacterium]|nr:electron transport complex subunit E [Clostridiaceae bacterium]HNR03757.1 electron transport complex subunit E [Bacillota bacterium]HNT02364.1 electron transport complex subunit E [Bacillota bacterium]HNU80124.1 electron transport complex subunit E [Bacillota bacterium]HPA54604.1 electron transport complex subunit E [Bacillota bacterium]
MNLWKDFSNGLIKENPTFRLVLGTCPTLAVTTAVFNGIGMGIAAAAVLIGSNLIISLIKKIVPNEVRIPIYIVVIATFTTIVQMLIQAFSPALDKSLGIYIPLIVVNCIIIARAEAFAAKNPVANSIMDGLGMGIGFTVALTIISSVREILGAGTFLGMPLFGEAFEPFLIMILPPGGFLVFGLSIAAFNKITSLRKS